METSNEKTILLCSTGSVSVGALVLLLASLLKYKVKLLMSRSAQNFISNESMNDLCKDSISEELIGNLEIITFTEMDQNMWKHCCKLAKESSVLAVVPLSGNTLGKIAIGLSDDPIVYLINYIDCYIPIVGK